ncbi:hypothetical protein [Metabacillus idriensis]|uniref:hypothetical protein n=1 Tax=Metabacillus idriensis TaxID=324768 RepID=UPI00174C5C01|nr:hypothetical protein [Metabacillus idriensis]
MLMDPYGELRGIKRTLIALVIVTLFSGGASRVEVSTDEKTEGTNRQLTQIGENTFGMIDEWGDLKIFEYDQAKKSVVTDLNFEIGFLVLQEMMTFNMIVDIAIRFGLRFCSFSIMRGGILAF